MSLNIKVLVEDGNSGSMGASARYPTQWWLMVETEKNLKPQEDFTREPTLAVSLYLCGRRYELHDRESRAGTLHCRLEDRKGKHAFNILTVCQ
ncbi:hypothetical protein Syun_029412 [Stephania yunnanensis]|uniref:Uncharacterized protein n=1 Tax=Stephania yunnanensis TaxID=152371 RepID=A0AAP0E8J7_9MAGN